MTTVSPFAELLGKVIYEFELIRPLLPTYGHLILSALFPIYTGAHASLSRPSSAAKPPKKRKDDSYSGDEEEDEGKDNLQKMEGLEPSDALMFPLMAGLTLGGLYLIIKWLEDPAILNKILSFYFSQMGLFFATAFLRDGLLVIRSFILPSRYRHGGHLWKAKQSRRVFAVSGEEEDRNLEGIHVRQSPLPGMLGDIPLPSSILNFLWFCRGLAYQKVTCRAHIRGVLDVKARLGLLDVTGGAIALVAVAYFAFVDKPWWLTNLLGFSFCYGALQFMSPSTFWTGSLILGSLFFYDIYFVFFTPLMVTVATKLDVPIKLLIPRPPSPGEGLDKISLAMLGLGDIVIPGMMLGLALRYDLFLYYRRKGIQKAQAAGTGGEFIKPQYQTATGGWGERFWTREMPSRESRLHPPYPDAQSFPKTYFHASLVGYIIGMVVTLLVMQYSNHAQPALLYLVPGVLTSLWGTALVKGELRSMWAFSDSTEDEEDAEGAKGDKQDMKGENADKGVRRSLFARIMSGDIKGLSADSEGKDKTERGAGQKVEKNTESPVLSDDDAPETASNASKSPRQIHNDNGDERNERNLISFSISLPKRKSLRRQKDHADDSATAVEPKDAVSSAIERDGEPPAKKRRPSPKNIM
jgi:minor histocompatibility antigen H13